MKSIFLNDEASTPVELDTRESAASLSAMHGLLLVVTLIVVFGLTMLYSASYNTDGLKYFRNQIIWAIMGGFGGAAAFIIGYRKLASWSGFFMGLSLLLLLIAAFCFPAINGANRWIKFRLPGLEMTLQPSEFAKIAVTLFVAKYCTDNIRTFNQLRGKRGLLPLVGISGAVICAILIGRDFGTTLLVLTVTVVIAWIAGLRWFYLAIPVFFSALVATYVVLFDANRLSRVTTFLRPEEMREGSGYQLWTSLLAFGSGGWTGVGFMESRLKQKYLPEQHTDFVLSIVGEELGLIGMLAVIALYVAFTWYGLRISLNSRSRLGMLVSCGLTLGISIQAAINLAVVTGSVPTKGMPAAFISYGGSNMMASLIAVGILVSIAFDNAYMNYNAQYLNSIRAKLAFLPFFRHYRKDEEE
ncbi:MAG: FtsW/RodA/SpoVE family cell cycle protein [Victivallales bacterium]|nr:FtsW/RodA/SpoVE family cell cycle protein [Victivallales bacterium]